jgi:NAD-dependent deacetylase sirtuin 4
VFLLPQAYPITGTPDIIIIHRGENGIYKTNANYKPITYQQFVSDSSFRQRYWARSFLGFPKLAYAQPNETHHLLTRLQSMQKIHSIMTQNVDSLHSKAGSTNVLEIHGQLDKVICLSCSSILSRHDFQQILHDFNPNATQILQLFKDQAPDVASSTRISKNSLNVNPDGDVDATKEFIVNFKYPSCLSCTHGILKPNVVFFGENMSLDTRDESFNRIDSADALLVIGTSLQVYSAYRLLKRAYSQEKPIFIVNLGETRGDSMATDKVIENSSVFLREWMNVINRESIS